MKLVNINELVVQVQADDATPLGHLKHINGLWKFKALGFDAHGGLVPGGGPLTDRHNAVFETLDPAVVAARLFPPIATPSATPMATPTLNQVATPPCVLQARGLRFAYPQQAPLFEALDLDLPAGLSWVQGGDGCGKSTLLRLLAGELRAQAGQLQFVGLGLAQKLAPQQYAQQVCWIDPRTADFDAISARAFFQSRAELPQGLDGERLLALIAGLSLTEHLDKPLYMLSTGSKRKVWLSAALASTAALTLLDDPFAALDQPSIRCVMAQLQLAAQHLTRACVVAGFDAPGAVLADLPLAATVALGG